MSAELEFADVPVHEGVAPPVVKKTRRRRMTESGEAEATMAPLSPEFSMNEPPSPGVASARPVSARRRAAASASAGPTTVEPASLQAEPANGNVSDSKTTRSLQVEDASGEKPRTRARAKRRVAGGDEMDAPALPLAPAVEQFFEAREPSIAEARQPSTAEAREPRVREAREPRVAISTDAATALPRADAMPQESFTPRERAERQARADRAAFRAERQAVISNTEIYNAPSESVSTPASSYGAQTEGTRRSEAREPRRFDRSASNVGASSTGGDEPSFNSFEPAIAIDGSSSEDDSDGETGPGGSHIPHGMGQSKSSRRRRRKRKNKTGGEAPQGGATVIPTPFQPAYANGQNGQLSQSNPGVTAPQTLTSDQMQPSQMRQMSASASTLGMPGRAVTPPQNGFAGVPNQNGFGQNGAGQNGFGQNGAAQGKRWKKKFRDRERPRFGDSNGAPSAGNVAAAPLSNGGGFTSQFPRDNNSFQPGNTVSGFKRKTQQGGKQRRDRSFVGPMDHSYRETNGNFADVSASTVEAHGNYQRRSSGGGRAYQGDSQPIDYSQGRAIPIAEDAPTKIYFFIDDLFFVAKIQETARKMGVKVGFLKNEKESLDPILDLEAELRPGLIVVDLSNANAKPLTLIPKLKAKLKRSTSVVGFLSLLQSDLRAKAVEAGCDTVMARAAFSQNLPNLLRRYGIEEKEEESNFNQ